MKPTEIKMDVGMGTDIQNTYFGTLLTLAVTAHRQVQLSDRWVYRVCLRAL